MTIEILPPKKADLQPVDSSTSPRNIAQEAVTSVPKKEKTGSSGRQNATAKTVSADPASTRKGSVGRPAKGSDADLTSVSKLFKSQEDANQRQRAVAEKMAQAIAPLAEALAMIDDDDLFAQTVEALKDNLATIPMDAKTRDALDTMFEYIERKRSSRR